MGHKRGEKKLFKFISSLLKSEKEKIIEKIKNSLDEWRFKDHNPIQGCKCEKCELYYDLLKKLIQLSQ